MQPVAFGYMHTRPGLADHGRRSGAEELSDYAQCHGYYLARVFTEQEEPGSPAFALLMDALRTSGCPAVIVPDMRHFAQAPGLRRAMKEHIERETGARVLIAHDGHTDNLPETEGISAQ